MIKIVVAGINGCLGSAFIGLTDALTLARDAIASATGVEPPFQLVTASADRAGIIDGFGRRFEVAASFEEIASCDAVLTRAFNRTKRAAASCLNSRASRPGFGDSIPVGPWSAAPGPECFCSARPVCWTDADARPAGAASTN